MSLLRPISIFLRNALVKQHPYFSCCASCGEITTPLESRLCASLAFIHPVDAVILSNDATSVRTAASLKRHCPWLRYIFSISNEGTTAPDITRTGHIRHIPTEAFSPTDSLFGPEAHCHNIPGISEYFLIVPPGYSPERNLLPLDFFTPNGIPLIRLRKIDGDCGSINGCAWLPGIIAQTRENAAAFLMEAEKTSQSGTTEYYDDVARWAFHTGRAVPANA